MLSRSRTAIADASIIWNHLNGIINVYKPAGVKNMNVRNAILHKLCSDLNELKIRPPRKRLSIEQVKPSNIDNDLDIENIKYNIEITKDLSDDILAVGQRYQIEDFKYLAPANLGVDTSGVLLVGINNGIYDCFKLKNNKSIRIYHVRGCLGTATDSYFKDSRITVKARYSHVGPDKFAALLSSMQASHQKKMFELCGVDLQSQTAYKLAVKGLIKPLNNTSPVIYGLKCIELKQPEFVIEVVAINENEQYLKTLINEIGIELRTVAHCTGIQCIKHGYFDVNQSLLRGQWTLQNVITNMEECRKIFRQHPDILRPKDNKLFVNA